MVSGSHQYVEFQLSFQLSYLKNFLNLFLASKRLNELHEFTLVNLKSVEFLDIIFALYKKNTENHLNFTIVGGLAIDKLIHKQPVYLWNIHIIIKKSENELKKETTWIRTDGFRITVQPNS